MKVHTLGCASSSLSTSRITGFLLGSSLSSPAVPNINSSLSSFSSLLSCNYNTAGTGLSMLHIFCALRHILNPKTDPWGVFGCTIGDAVLQNWICEKISLKNGLVALKMSKSLVNTKQDKLSISYMNSYMNTNSAKETKQWFSDTV